MLTLTWESGAGHASTPVPWVLVMGLDDGSRVSWRDRQIVRFGMGSSPDERNPYTDFYLVHHGCFLPFSYCRQDIPIEKVYCARQ